MTVTIQLMGEFGHDNDLMQRITQILQDAGVRFSSQNMSTYTNKRGVNKVSLTGNLSEESVMVLMGHTQPILSQGKTGIAALDKAIERRALALQRQAHLLPHTHGIH